ncbi:tyrosine-type recombinase/integrase [Aurantimicrobium minutum]|uniref:tyrosine-type recombinase/integrase n=1 Tax=Aurantimicrobium minutum TaxID=708131 RepID=UPI002476D8AD|nr:tyrosine-type recombinase/integrase [Aurantimicrobium minutum]
MWRGYPYYKWVRSTTGGFNTHSLRHRAGSNAYKATHDIRAVQELLGHKSISTTQIYTTVEPDSLIALVQANQLEIATKCA